MSHKIITQKEFDSIHAEHLIWLEDNSKGKQGDFSNYDLTNYGISITNRNFSKSICRNTKFSHYAYDINFTDADLTGASFYGVDITRADFERATLVDVDFTEVELGTANFVDAYVLNCQFTSDKPKHLTNAIIKTSEKIMALTKPKTSALKMSFVNNKHIEKIGNQLSKSLEVTLAKKSSEIITNNTKKALIAAKIPKTLVNHPLFNALLEISAPQLLRILLPYIPQLKKNNNAQKLLELACQGAITSVSSETLEYVITQTLPILKQLNGPQFKELGLGE